MICYMPTVFLSSTLLPQDTDVKRDVCEGAQSLTVKYNINTSCSLHTLCLTDRKTRIDY